MSCTLTPIEVQSLLQRGVMRKLVPQPESERLANRQYHRERRQRFYRLGLNYAGLPRKYANLSGMTPEQKHERRKAQQRDWMRKNRKK